MSEMGHTFAGSKRMSALPPKADIRVAPRLLWPEGDISKLPDRGISSLG